MRALEGVARGDAGRPAGEGCGRRISPSRRSARPTATVVRLVRSTLYDAIKAGASDVHLESTGNGLTIKYRIDGVLTPAESVPRHRSSPSR